MIILVSCTKKTNTTLEATVNELQESYAMLDEAYKDIETKNVRLNSELDSLKELKNKLEWNLSNLTNTVNELEAENRNLVKELQQLKTQYVDNDSFLLVCKEETNRGTKKLELKRVQENQRFTFKHLSPDKSKYASIRSDYGFEVSYDISFIENKDISHYTSFAYDNHTLKWINDNKIFIDGEIIYDFEKDDKFIIDYSHLRSKPDDYIFNRNSSISIDNKEIAYVIALNNEEFIYTYNIETNEWKQIWKNYVITEFDGFHVYWSYENDVYFDSWGVLLDKNQDIVEPRTAFANIYCVVDGKVEVALSDYSFHEASFDYKSAIVEKYKLFRTYSVFDFKSNRITHTFESDNISSICWSNDSNYIAYYDDSSDELFVYSIRTNESYSYDISNLDGDLCELRAEDDYFAIYMMKSGMIEEDEADFGDIYHLKLVDN